MTVLDIISPFYFRFTFSTRPWQSTLIDDASTVFGPFASVALPKYILYLVSATLSSDSLKSNWRHCEIQFKMSLLF